MGECCALAFLAGNEQHGSHRSGHTGTHRAYVRRNKLHGIVNTQARRHATAGAVYIYGNVLVGVYGVEIEQLRLYRIGRIVVYRCSEKDDTFHHQTREHVHLSNVQLTFLKDIRVEILRLSSYHAVENHTVYTKMPYGIFPKIIHICCCYNLKQKRGHRPFYSFFVLQS